MNEKPFIQSKTVLFNFIMVLLFVLNRQVEVLPFAIAEPATIVIMGAGNWFLRKITNSAIYGWFRG